MNEERGSDAAGDLGFQLLPGLTVPNRIHLRTQLGDLALVPGDGFDEVGVR